jgi:transcriptional repressor NrdR
VNCPLGAHSEHRVLESRTSDAKDAIRRRRECRECGHRFTTYERIEEAPLVVVKSSGERQPFDRAKVFAGLQRACHKREVPTAVLEEAVRDIEAAIRNELRGEITSAAIGDLVLRRLKSIDSVAYVRFASVYRQFSGVEEFADELARLEREPPLIDAQPALDDRLFADLVDPAPLIGATAVNENRLSLKETPDGD